MGLYTYATNWHLGVRVPRRDDVIRSDGPDFEKVIAEAPPAVDLRPVPIELVPPMEPCAKCEGAGHIRMCESCDGCGEIFAIGDDEKGVECQTCKGRGWLVCNRSAHDAENCWVCDGAGSLPGGSRDLGIELRPGVLIAPRYIALIGTLPSVRIDFAAPHADKPVRFEFDDGGLLGIGVVMPMRAGAIPEEGIIRATSRLKSPAEVAP